MELHTNYRLDGRFQKEVKTSVRPPSAVQQCPSPSDSPPTDGPTDHIKLLLTLPLFDVRRPTWGQYSWVNPIRCLQHSNIKKKSIPFTEGSPEVEKKDKMIIVANFYCMLRNCKVP